MIDQDLPYVLQLVKEQICLKLRQAKCSIPFDATTAPERKGELLDSYLRTLRAVFPTQKDLPAFFFLFCIKLLQDDSCITLNPEPILENSQKRNREESRDSHKRAKCSSFKRNEGSGNQRPSSERLVFAIKCSLTLGLAVLIGLIYNKEEAYWSGLTIAISFVTGRQATFTLANARAQGTVMGSVYGVLGCFIFQKFVKMRFLLLFPWIIFTSFLKHSRMYGQAGGVSAVIGALLILGRKDYGTPSEFAIARIAEAFIGLSCFIMVEFILRPMRAATLAKSQLSRTLGALRECIKELALYDDQKNMPVPLLLALRAKQKKLKFNVNELEKFIGEAELEPSMWFLPFHGACYKNLFGSVSKMVDLLLFVAYKIEFLLEASEIVEVAWKELQEDLNKDLQQFKEKVGSSLKCLEEVTLIKSLAVLDKKLQKANISHDVELGKSPHSNEFRLLSTDEEVVEKILSSFLQHSREVNEKIHATEGEEELKSQMVLVLSGLGFCINSLMSETIEIEKHVKELVKWENPSRLINLYEISSKINALYTFNSRTTTP
ncbi:hypothetical protein L1049_008139 [Liquidambar formosana]|uniref:Integral membrane bound transporter domain-containing protein n=1 Tax=Liquidambar formosana TaxID=63359 RepID=A0AAP0S3U3_LIQFO